MMTACASSIPTPTVIEAPAPNNPKSAPAIATGINFPRYQLNHPQDCRNHSTKHTSQNLEESSRWDSD